MNSIFKRIYSCLDEDNDDTTITTESSNEDLSLDNFLFEDNDSNIVSYKNILISEAPGDDAANLAAGGETPADDAGGEDAATDDDFSIDTNLDDNNDEGNNDDVEDGFSTDDADMSDSSSEGELNDDSGEEVTGDNDGESADENNDEDAVQDNEDIFFSLSAEEQQIKIMELKKQYSDLYNGCDDILDKVNNMDISECDIEVISKISNTLYTLKGYISDYLYNVFPDKSYLENDVAYNTFLSTFNSVSTILSKLADSIEKERKENNKDYVSDFDNDKN
jgi:hypothetical protein